MKQTQNFYAKDGDYPNSYYAASRNDAPERERLTGEQSCDIAIIGGGYSGLSTAIHLLEKGHKVTLIEGARIGWGASGRNGGQVVNGINAALPRIRKYFGKNVANEVGPLLQEGRDIIFRLVKDYDIQCDLKQGNIFTAFNEAHMKEMDEKAQDWAGFGVGGMERLTKQDISLHIGSQSYYGGYIDQKGGHLHPLNLALGEAATIEKLGGKIYELSPVTHIEEFDQHSIIYTNQGVMKAKIVVICGNAYLGKVIKKLTPRIMPVSTQMMATKPLSDEVANRILPTDKCVEDVRYILDYYRLSGDKRLIWGGGTIYGGKDPSDIEAMLRKNLRKIFPELSDIEVDYVWSGWFALSFTRMPQIGRLNNHTYFAHGYSGHGVTGSHLFGKILAEAINGDQSRYDVFSALRWVPFPGGRMFRVQYSAFGAWYYGLKDKLGF